MPPLCWKVRNHFKGFTLAELLIALAILGGIAAFTIPKILSVQQNGQRISVFRESIASIEAVTYQQYQAGNFTAGNNGSVILNGMNAVKICNSDASTEGCWTQAGGGGELTQPGLVLHNGATITGLDDLSGTTNGFYLDWNGPDGPNTQGQDQSYLIMNFGPTAINWAGYTVKPGMLGPFNASSAVLWSSIFQ